MSSSVSKGILNNYIITKLLGRGTFSTVKLATDIRTNEKIAIKILEKNKIKTERDINRINREISIVKKINHLNIVKVFEIKEDKDKYYILMEYCENGELFDLILEKRKLTEDESSYYFFQLVNGLDYIHKNNIIHRDLKPENLLLTKNNILKIIDFGLSNYNTKDNLLSTPCGSPCYASPEMVSGKKYNGITNDIWSIGIILYAMIYGYLPFENINNNNDLLFKKIRECKIDYPKNNSILALNLLKKILIPDCNKRIKINEIKKDNFYIKGKNIFKRKHRDINLDINNYMSNNITMKKRIKKYSNSEFNSGIYNIYNNDYNLNDDVQFLSNRNITENIIIKNNKKLLNKRNINKISPKERIIRNNNNNENTRATFSYDINNKTEIKLNNKKDSSYSQRKTNIIVVPHIKIDNIKNYDRIKSMKSEEECKTESKYINKNSYRSKTKSIINDEIYQLSPSSQNRTTKGQNLKKLNYFGDKFPDYNSFSVEEENEYFYEPFPHYKKILSPLNIHHYEQNQGTIKLIRHNNNNNQSYNKNNLLSSGEKKYSASEIRKIIADKKKINKNIENNKPISIININNNNDTYPKNNQFSYKKYRNDTKSEKNNNIINNKENYSINNHNKKNLSIDNDYSNDNPNNKDSKKYNNTSAERSQSKYLSNNNKTNTTKSMQYKYFHNKIINKFTSNSKKSEEKYKNKSNSEMNQRIETSLGKNYINNNNYINGQKKISNGNINFSSINNDNSNNISRKNYRRIYQNRIKNEETKEKEDNNKETKKNKGFIVNENNYVLNIKKNYKYNINNKSFKIIENNKDNRRNHETYTYIHKNINNINDNKNKNNNDININDNKYQRYKIINNNKNIEEISKINNSYDNNKKFEKNYGIHNKIFSNINKISMTNLPSFTIDMNILNKNNNKYLKFYDAIKNKL